MTDSILVGNGFSYLENDELLLVDGGLNFWVAVGGCIGIGISVVAVVASASIGLAVGGPAGAVGAGAACAKAVTPLVLSSAGAIALAHM